MNLTFKIHKPLAVVFDHLTDMQKFVSIHPVISKMELTKENTYFVHETLQFGFIPFSFTYYATVEQDKPNNKVFIKATVMKLTKIEMAYSMREENMITIVDEFISFRSVLPVKFIMSRIFKKQHALLFQNLNAVPS